MKKFFILMTLLCVSFTAFSQAYFGGTIGATVRNIDSETSSAIMISPEGGYKFNSIWAAGASLSVQIGTGSGSDVTAIALLPYVRATFARASIVDFFGELAMGYIYASAGGSSASGFSAGIRPGLAINFSDRFALIGRTTLLSYSYCEEINDIGFALNGNFELGVQYTF